jgi:hypothetical protein
MTGESNAPEAKLEVNCSGEDLKRARDFSAASRRQGLSVTDKKERS